MPVVRSLAKWEAAGLGLVPRVADLFDAPALRLALLDATHVLCCAHARHVPLVLAAAPAEACFVFLGSTRKFSRWPDAHGDGVRVGEAAFLASGRPGVMLHPTMIYGARGEDNVQRLAALLRVLPVVPLPAGGQALVQPICQDDLTACILAALGIDWAGPESLVVAGPEAMTYAAFVRDIAASAGLRRAIPVSVPAFLLRAAAWLTRLLPGVPTVRSAEIRRLLEDKAFDIAPMRERLGVVPRGLREGLTALFAKDNGPA